MADKLKIWTRFEYTTLNRQMNNSTRSVQCWRLYYNTRGCLPSGMLSFSICTDTDVHNDHRRAVLRFGYIKCRSCYAVQFMHENTRDHQVTKLRSRGVGKLLLNGNKTTRACVPTSLVITKVDWTHSSRSTYTLPFSQINHVNWYVILFPV